MKKRLFFLLLILFIFFFLFLFFSRKEIVHLYTTYIRNSSTTHEYQEKQEENHSSNLPIKITFFDIGQGDASFIEWGDGTQMLVDCAVDARILEALGRGMSAFDRTIDYLLITHPDQDHYGGCVDVMKRFEIKHIVYSGFEKAQSSYFSVFKKTIDEEVAQNATYNSIEKEEIWNIDDSSIHFLYPDMPIAKHPLIYQKNPKDVSNDTSIVFVLEYGKEKVLFTGDMEFLLENYLMKKYGHNLLNVDVLKVGHHGSGGSSSDIFLSELSPKISVISVGEKNRYAHPSLRTLKRLERVGTEIWRTDEKSDIIVRVTKDAVYVENE